MKNYITESAAYKLWLDGGYDEIMPFKDSFGGYDFVEYLHNRGIDIIYEGDIDDRQYSKE